MKIVVVTLDPALVALVGSAGVEAVRVAPEEALSEVPRARADRAVVDLRGSEGLALLRQLLPVLPVIGACQSSDGPLVVEALRAGATDVLFVDRPGDARAAIRSPVRQAGPVVASSRRGNVIVLTSSQGGVGRSTVALNLALLLSEAGSVTLVDMVPSHGVLHVLCDLQPDRTVLDAVSQGATPEAVSRSWVEWEGIRLLAAPASQDTWRPDEGTVERLLESCAVLSDHVVVDLERVPERYTAAALDRASLVIALCRMTVPGLRNMRGYVQDLGRMHVPLQKVMVVGVGGRWGISVQDAEEVSGLRVVHVLPWDQTAVWAENQGVPLVIGAARSPLARSLRALADAVLDRLLAPAELPVEVTV